jgi:hypothetical protein
MNTLKIHPIEKNSSVSVQPAGPPQRKDSFEEEIDKIDRKNSIHNNGDDTPKMASLHHDNKP